jgi:ABC-type glutathione transport system ATPase component
VCRAHSYAGGAARGAAFDVDTISYACITADVRRPALSLKALLRRGGAPPAAPRRILRAVSVTLRRGDLIAIIGPSGCGKARAARVATRACMRERS